MADQLNLGGLSLGDSKHAAANGLVGHSAYIPPHLRNVPPPPPGMDPRAPPPANAGPVPGPGPSPGMNASAWASNSG